jgi:hypothetical protein
LNDPQKWRLKGQSALRVAKVHFQPEQIQARFEAHLTKPNIFQTAALSSAAQPFSLS